MAIVIFFLVSFLTACGGADFSGSAASKDRGQLPLDPPPLLGVEVNGTDPEVPPAGNETLSLTWNLPCDSENLGDQGTVQDTMEQGGNFAVSNSEQNAVALTFQGEFCESPEPPVDVLFVLDTSNSMRRNDPRVGNLCGRLLAVQQVIETLSANSERDHRFGIVTFASSALEASTGFFRTEAELFADLSQTSGQAEIADILCYSKLGTDFNDAFSAARLMIHASVRAQAQTQLYLVSDGQPLFNQTGKSIADELKWQGTSIATIMVDGNESILKTLSSKDSYGQPLHRTLSHIDELTDAILDLANTASFPSVIRFRPIGSDAFSTQQIHQTANGSFILDPYVDNTPTSGAGLEMIYQYFGSGHSGRKQIQGTVSWGE